MRILLNRLNKIKSQMCIKDMNKTKLTVVDRRNLTLEPKKQIKSYETVRSYVRLGSISLVCLFSSYDTSLVIILKVYFFINKTNKIFEKLVTAYFRCHRSQFAFGRVKHDCFFFFHYSSI